MAGDARDAQDSATLQHASAAATEPPSGDGFDADLVGRRILQFKVVARLGAGGMGVVYKAIDEKLRRGVALKVLSRRYLADERNKELVFREARSAAAVTHQSIAAIYDVYDTPDGALIAMELVEGESLRARLARGPLAIGEVRRIAREIAGGVARAHETGIVHRDLKPDNVMLGRDGRVKLLDFGLAKTMYELEPVASVGEHASPAVAATMLATAGPTGRVMGTPAYMAPEQARGETVDARADVFSLGALVFELLADETPFAHRTTGPREWAGIDSDDWKPRVSLRGLRPDVPKELEAIVARCLDGHLDRRFANAGELAAALDALPTPGTRARLGLAIAGLLIALGAAVAITTWRARETPPTALAAADAAVQLEAVLAIADVPASPTSSPAALAAFREGLKLFGADNAAATLAKLDDALRLDPAFASAQLQRAAIASTLKYDLEEAGRSKYAKAVAAQAALSTRDRELLTAIAPAFRDPPDWPAEIRELQAFVARRSGDSEAWYALGAAQTKAGQFADALLSLERQAALEPHSTLGHTTRADIQLRQRDVAGATSTLADCLARNPREVPCRLAMLQLDNLAGRCMEMEAGARELTAIKPDAPDGYLARATANVMLGAPEVAIAQLLADRRAHLSEAERPDAELSDRQSLAQWRGDFVELLKLQDQIDARTSPPTLYSLTYSAWVRAYFLNESGDRVGAARAAATAIDRLAASPRVEQVQGDPTMALYAFMQRGGLISRAELVKRRDAWVAYWRARIDAQAWRELGFIVWSKAYSELFAYGDMSDADAREAVAVLPQYGALPAIGAVDDDLPTGITLYRGGRVAEALSRFQARARACNPEWDNILANAWLGTASEASGYRATACEAYTVIIRRWGHAKPRSVSVEGARAGVRRLGCVLPP